MLMLFFQTAPNGAAPGDARTLFWILAILALIVFLGRKRSRHIPIKSKRLAQAKLFNEFHNDPRNEGKKLHLKGFEYDHHHPYSLGGSHDPDNIRLIPKKANRKKGAKPPDLWPFG